MARVSCVNDIHSRVEIEWEIPMWVCRGGSRKIGSVCVCGGGGGGGGGLSYTWIGIDLTWYP